MIVTLTSYLFFNTNLSLHEQELSSPSISPCFWLCSLREDSIIVVERCCKKQNLNLLPCTFAQILRGQTNLSVLYESVSCLKQSVLPARRVISLLFQFLLNLRKGIAVIRILKQLRTVHFSS